MKQIYSSAFLVLLMITNAVAQNTSPFWSLNGNNNATLTNKIGTTNNVSLRFVTNNVERMKIMGSGNIGIGTTSPVVKLQVASNDDADLNGGGAVVVGSLSGANIAIDNNEILARTNGAASALFLNHNGSNIIMNGTNAAGNVSIGTTTPANRFHVRQNLPNKAIEWQHETQADFWTVGIGTNTLNCRFEFNGALRGQISSVDGSFIAGSDRRLKDDIQPIEGMLEKIMQLKPSSYYYKDSRNAASHKTLGFVAQEVEEVIPEAVYEMDGGLKGISYGAFSVAAIRGLQEQQKAFNEQQEKIAALQNEIEELKDMVRRLDRDRAPALSNAWMKQNAPNPFNASSVVQYFVPDDAASARILLTNAKGQQLKYWTLSRGTGTISLSSGTLAAGAYSYSLIVDGKTVATKKLVIAR